MKITKTYRLSAKDYVEYLHVVRGDEKEELSAIWRLGCLGRSDPEYTEVDLRPYQINPEIRQYIEIDDDLYTIEGSLNIGQAAPIYRIGAENHSMRYLTYHGKVITILIPKDLHAEVLTQQLRCNYLQLLIVVEEALSEMVEGKLFNWWRGDKPSYSFSQYFNSLFGDLSLERYKEFLGRMHREFPLAKSFPFENITIFKPYDITRNKEQSTGHISRSRREAQPGGHRSFN